MVACFTSLLLPLGCLARLCGRLYATHVCEDPDVSYPFPDDLLLMPFHKQSSLRSAQEQCVLQKPAASRC